MFICLGVGFAFVVLVVLALLWHHFNFPDPVSWERLTRRFDNVPRSFKFADGDADQSVYQHGTSVLALAFSPDNGTLALAGGGMLPNADPTIRLIDVGTGRNVRTLHGHTHGIHDLSFDQETGLLASASYDYAVYLWNLEQNDIIYLMGEDYKTKGYSRFSARGSLLAVGEYAHYEGPHSFYVYDLQKRKRVFAFSLPNEMGVTGLCISSAGTKMAVAAGLDELPAQVYLIDLTNMDLMHTHSLPTWQIDSLVFAEGESVLLAGAIDEEYEEHLLNIDPQTGSIRWTEKLGGIGVCLATHPNGKEVAVAFEHPAIRVYQPTTGKVLREVPVEVIGASSICALAYSPDGSMLAYGFSGGRFRIIDVTQSRPASLDQVDH